MGDCLVNVPAGSPESESCISTKLNPAEVTFSFACALVIVAVMVGTVPISVADLRLMV